MDESTVAVSGTPLAGAVRLLSGIRMPIRTTTIIAVAGTGIAAGLYFGWGWVVATGLSSILIALLPCALMCAAGLCLGRCRKQTATTRGAASVTAGASANPGPAQADGSSDVSSATSSEAATSSR